ncbi:MAG TPA: septum formation initiator family protein [Rhodobacteraceae bacterium]|nr:septum formation initiator family protein [Paracoccaceae bacterium]
MVSMRIRLRHIIIPVVGVATLSYFAYHTLVGERGLRSYWRMQVQTAKLEKQLRAVRAERLKMEAKVTLLRPESLDPDMLDERVREILNLARPDEVTILLNPK